MTHCIHWCTPYNVWGSYNPLTKEWPHLEPVDQSWHGVSTMSHEYLRAENLITGEIRTSANWGLKEAVWFATRKFPVREAGLKALRKEREKYRRNKRSHKPNP